jgi:hypothetical protein
VDDLWNPEEANELLRPVLVEIEALAEQLSPARAEALGRAASHRCREALQEGRQWAAPAPSTLNSSLREIIKRIFSPKPHRRSLNLSRLKLNCSMSCQRGRTSAV